jgi:hypothetical protein
LIVIFNGPPGSGKDEAARYFQARGFKHLSFKHALFRETVREFDVSYKWFMDRYNDRSVKERPEKRLRGMSRREALIYTSEEVIKPRYGKDFFGVQVAKEIVNENDYCISDGGFVEELLSVINRIGSDNIVLVQLTRDGCDYSSDSRRYFDGNLVHEYTISKNTPIHQNHVLDEKFQIRMYRIHNNGSISQFHDVLQDIYLKETQIKKERDADEKREGFFSHILGESI